jgi:hypothetical protein
MFDSIIIIIGILSCTIVTSCSLAARIKNRFYYFAEFFFLVAAHEFDGFSLSFSPAQPEDPRAPIPPEGEAEAN